MSQMDFRILPVGDSAAFIIFGDKVDVAANKRANGFAEGLKRAGIPGVQSINTAYASVLVCYNPEIIDYEGLYNRILAWVNTYKMSESGIEEEWICIPVLYGLKGSHIETVAEYEGMTVKEVVMRHITSDYYVFMLGFSPGMAYIGSPDGGFTIPRMKNPTLRPFTQPVSVCANQTMVGSGKVGMGGWHVIGRTPVCVFDINRKNPCLFRPGQWVRFYPVDQQKFDEISALTAAGKYKPRILNHRPIVLNKNY